MMNNENRTTLPDRHHAHKKEDTHHVPLKKKALNRRLLMWSIDEIRQGYLWSISAALTLIIASIFALSALSERLEQVVVKQGKEALTADRVFTSSQPLPATLMALSQQPQFMYSVLTRFSTMAFSETAMQLVMVKAVDSSYPLRSALRLENQTQQQSHVQPNELWVEKSALTALNVEIGDTITLGNSDFMINGVITQEPGVAFNPFQQMPVVYIHQHDIERTGALQTGSRLQFNLFLVGEESQLDALEQSIVITDNDRWKKEDSFNRSNELFERTRQYLSLTLLIIIIMATSTLVLTCQHYVNSRRQTVAMLKSMGADKPWLVRWLIIQILFLVSIALVGGLVIGVLLETLLRIPLHDLLPEPLPSYGVTPAITAIVSSVVMAIPALGIPLSRLINTPAVAVMSSTQTLPSVGFSSWKVKQSNRNTVLRNIILMAIPLLLVMWIYRANSLIWLVILSIVVLFFLLVLLTLIITRLLAKLPLKTEMNLALSRINRTPLSSGIQFGALTLSLMLLSMVWLVRTDLLNDWQRTLPADAPNAFAFNIATTEKEAYLSELEQAHIEHSKVYPIILGRLSKINSIDAKHYVKGAENSDALRREINFTWSDTLPNYNTLSAGEWGSRQSVSVESKVAADLGIKVGDNLSFTINSQLVNATVNSIREVEWREMKPNFYFIFSPDLLQDMPLTWLLSIRLEPQHDEMLSTLSRRFPTVSLIDIRLVGYKLQQLLGEMMWSITLLAGVGVIAGLLLIFTLLRLGLSQRQDEIRLYRTLGSSRQSVYRTIWYEYGVMALVSGLVASISSDLAVASVMKYGFKLEAVSHPIVWIVLPTIAFLLLTMVIYSLIKSLLVPINK